MNKNKLTNSTPHPPEHLSTYFNRPKNSIKKQLKNYHRILRLLSINGVLQRNPLKITLVNEIESQIRSLTKATNIVHFDPNTEDPSKKVGYLLDMILSEYKVQLRNKSAEKPVLTIKEVINETITTGISYGENIEIFRREGVFIVPETIGSCSVEEFIDNIQKINNEERRLLKSKKNGNSYGITEPINQQTTTQHRTPSPEETHLPLINTKRNSAPLHRYKPFFPSAESIVAKEKRALQCELTPTK